MELVHLNKVHYKLTDSFGYYDIYKNMPILYKYIRFECPHLYTKNLQVFIIVKKNYVQKVKDKKRTKRRALLITFPKGDNLININ